MVFVVVFVWASFLNGFQALAKQQENLQLEIDKQRLKDEIHQGQVAAAAWQQHQLLLQQQHQLQLEQQQQQQAAAAAEAAAAAAAAARATAAAAATATAAATAAAAPENPPIQPVPQPLLQDWKSIPVADDSLAKPWEAREDRCA